jgi:hypothetical protein
MQCYTVEDAGNAAHTVGGVFDGGAPYDAVHIVPEIAQILCEIAAVLAGNAGDDGFFRWHRITVPGVICRNRMHV